MVLAHGELEGSGADWAKERAGGLALVPQTFSASVVWDASTSPQALLFFAPPAGTGFENPSTGFHRV